MRRPGTQLLQRLGFSPICGEVEAKCICELGPDHLGPHICACGGSWLYNEPGGFHVLHWPEHTVAIVEQ